MIQTLNVALGDRSYPIHIGSGVLDRADLLVPHLGQKKVLVVSNTTVAPLYFDRLQSTLEKDG
ncbi:MAG: 3-dehydroquinate synthase, partial [Azonexus sp.]